MKRNDKTPEAVGRQLGLKLGALEAAEFRAYCHGLRVGWAEARRSVIEHRAAALQAELAWLKRGALGGHERLKAGVARPAHGKGRWILATDAARAEGIGVRAIYRRMGNGTLRSRKSDGRVEVLVR